MRPATASPDAAYPLPAVAAAKMPLTDCPVNTSSRPAAACEASSRGVAGAPSSGGHHGGTHAASPALPAMPPPHGAVLYVTRDVITTPATEVLITAAAPLASAPAAPSALLITAAAVASSDGTNEGGNSGPSNGAPLAVLVEHVEPTEGWRSATRCGRRGLSICFAHSFGACGGSRGTPESCNQIHLRRDVLAALRQRYPLPAREVFCRTVRARLPLGPMLYQFRSSELATTRGLLKYDSEFRAWLESGGNAPPVPHAASSGTTTVVPRPEPAVLCVPFAVGGSCDAGSECGLLHGRIALATCVADRAAAPPTPLAIATAALMFASQSVGILPTPPPLPVAALCLPGLAAAPPSSVESCGDGAHGDATVAAGPASREASPPHETTARPSSPPPPPAGDANGHWEPTPAPMENGDVSLLNGLVAIALANFRECMRPRRRSAATELQCA